MAKRKKQIKEIQIPTVDKVKKKRKSIFIIMKFRLIGDNYKGKQPYNRKDKEKPTYYRAKFDDFFKL